MLSGGGAAKAKLKEKLQSRHARAEARRQRLQEAKEADDDTVVEAVFDNMQASRTLPEVRFRANDCFCWL